MKKTSIVLFDAGGVLFPLNFKENDDSLSGKLGLSSQQIEKFWDSDLSNKLSLGQITTEEFLSEFANMFDLPREKVTKKLFSDIHGSHLEPIPGIRKLIERLKKTGIKLVVLSNTKEIFTQVRHEQGYYEPFEKLFLSYELGLRKPDPKIYQLVIDYYKIKPSEIFFVDDESRNIDIAKKLGMRGVVFENSKQLEQVLIKEGILSQ